MNYVYCFYWEEIKLSKLRLHFVLLEIEYGNLNKVFIHFMEVHFNFIILISVYSIFMVLIV